MLIFNGAVVSEYIKLFFLFVGFLCYFDHFLGNNFSPKKGLMFGKTISGKTDLAVSKWHIFHNMDKPKTVYTLFLC